MPTYQYACTACGERTEAVQAFSDAPLTECPACQGRLRKVFSAVGVVFKGSGFYKTDSRASAGAKAGGAKDDGAKGEGSKSEGAKGDGATATPAASGGKSEGSAGSTSAASSTSAA